MSEPEETELLAAESLRYALGHLTCPTCKTPPGVCCRCRGAVPLMLQGLMEDQVEHMRTGEEGVPPRQHLWCSGCLKSYVQDLETLRRDVVSRGGPADKAQALAKSVGEVYALTMRSTGRTT